MEPIIPEFPWQRYQHGDAMPEAELICAIIHRAFDDSISSNIFLRTEARRWFHSHQFKQYCELLNLKHIDTHECVIQQWNN